MMVLCSRTYKTLDKVNKAIQVVLLEEIHICLFETSLHDNII